MMVCYLSFAIMVMRRSNLDPVARQTCARLNAQQGSPRQALHGGVEHHWHVVATQPEVGSLPKQAWRIRRFAPTASLPPAVTGARDTGCALLPVQPRKPKSEVAHGTRRFIACTDSVTAARSNVAAEMSRAITCTVLFDRTAASNSIEQAKLRDGLRLTRDGPVADDPLAQARLVRGIEAALATANRRDTVPVAATLAVPRRSGGAWLVQVLAVNAATTGLFAGFTGALVMVTEPRLSSPSPAAVQAALNLTPAEAQLAVALASGITLADHAKTRGVSVETVRSHLASIRRKTGSRRQSELVALVASLPRHP
jgi:DNA-binding CsgD family transcriptional regulator